ncbi:hypothetical protein B0T22DRAFT_30480 [Podospora appendiculata]|uniref:Uncharacterized protein n=1 Tax=Podospora appendiculata TaxID=314037 RepID=A0AAE1CFZ6_9PEZI|nr:hypothetical protein B0T22DRAFT_30480 [Podospora appendiculata]
MESSFTDVERRFVLAEMIKVSQMDVGTLVEFIRHHDIQISPNWLQMQLPGGRNMNQCLRAAEAMFNTPIPAPAISPLKRRSVGDLNEHVSKKQAVASPGEASSPYAMPRNFSMQLPSIQPRPNGYPPMNPPVPAPAPTVVPARRRGRPPKAETMARQNTSQIIQYQPISPAPIAPSSGQAMAPQPQSPGPGGYPGYQIVGVSDPKSKKRGRQSGPERQILPETVPRIVQGTSGSETGARQAAAEYYDWREDREQRRNSGPGPVPLEPPIAPHHQLPPPRSPHPSLARARETTTTPLEQPNQETPAAVPDSA